MLSLGIDVGYRNFAYVLYDCFFGRVIAADKIDVGPRRKGLPYWKSADALIDNPEFAAAAHQADIVVIEKQMRAVHQVIEGIISFYFARNITRRVYNVAPVTLLSHNKIPRGSNGNGSKQPRIELVRRHCSDCEWARLRDISGGKFDDICDAYLYARYGAEKHLYPAEKKQQESLQSNF